MKTFSKIFAVSLLLLFNSCNVLNQDPVVELEDANPSVIIKDETSARAAITGAYHLFQDYNYYGARFIIATEMFTDNLDHTAFLDAYREMDSQHIPTYNEIAQWSYAAIYKTINLLNHVIVKTPDVVSETEVRDAILAEARFLRALCYHDLVRTFSQHWDGNALGVPMRSTPSYNPEFTPRSTVTENFEFIIQDLEFAIEHLAESSTPAYASKLAATALLARVYLYNKQYANAQAMASEVINSGIYELLPDYSDIYSIDNSKESIFELNFSIQDPSGYLKEYREKLEGSINVSLPNTFDANDQRASMIIVNPVAADQGLLTTEKFNSLDDPSYILRLAEMYTIRAEANAFLNGPAAGLDDLNTIRVRAGVEPLTAADVPDLNSFLNLLLLEKRKEFYLEGHYYYDLARLQKLEEVYGIENFRGCFPIPKIEIITAQALGQSLPQNPGY